METNSQCEPLETFGPPQYSLQTMLGAVTMLCAVFAVISYSWRPWFPGLIELLAPAIVLILIGGWGVLARRSDLIVIGGVTAVLTWMLCPAIQGNPTPSYRSYCQNNLKQIALALHNYHDVYKTFPPAYIADENGKPLHSWRVLILPYLEQDTLYKAYRFDEPWNGPNNSKLAAQVQNLDVYRCPADHGRNRAETSYVAVVGKETAWPGAAGIQFSEITDGTANTLLVVEVKNSGVHWMEPRDLDFSAMPRKINPIVPGGLCSEHKGGCNAVHCDGSTRFLPDETPAKELRALLTRSGDEPRSTE